MTRMTTMIGWACMTIGATSALAQNSIYEIREVSWSGYARVTAYSLPFVEGSPDAETSGSIVSPGNGEIVDREGWANKGQVWNEAPVSTGIARFDLNVYDYGELGSPIPGSATLFVSTIVRTDGLSSETPQVAGDLDVRAGASVTVRLELLKRSTMSISPFFGGAIGASALRSVWQHAEPGNVGAATSGFQVNGQSGFFLDVSSQMLPFDFGTQVNGFSPVVLEPGLYWLTFQAGTDADVSGETSILTEAFSQFPIMFVPIDECLADFDGSGFVDSDDFVAFLSAFELGCVAAGEDAFGPNPACTKGTDIDGTGFVDSDDFVEYVRLFELGC